MLSGTGLDEYAVDSEAIGRFLDRDGALLDRGYIHRPVAEFSNWLVCAPMSCGS
jgi:hypothetical protein